MPVAQVKVIPLGGVGEVGKNSIVIDTNRDLILVEAGVMFPEESMHGVDLVIPDFSYVYEHFDRFRGLLITHGHEDHIGAIPYFVSRAPGQVPIYATRLTLGLIQVKLKEHRMLGRVELYQVEPGEPVTLGKLRATFVHVTHSIPDAACIAIETPVGVIVHTGDFKFDPTPVSGPPSDVELLRKIGDQGVTALLSDTVRSDRPGSTPSEAIVARTLDAIIADAPGRLILTTFASNLIRVQQVIRLAFARGRRTAIVGRSMSENLNVARELGYLDVPEGAMIGIEEANTLPAQQVVVITTGSQGEPTSALARMAANDHRQIQIQEGDTVVLAATPVPGNEETVARTIDNLFRRGANVIYEAVHHGVHVSGHASRDELREMIELLRPTFIMPVHGEYRHLVFYRQLAVEAGVPAENVLLSDNGDIVHIRRDKIWKDGRVPASDVLVDGLTVGGVTQIVLRDRRRLAEEGILIVAVAVDRETGEIISGPELLARGLAENVDDLLEEGRRRVVKALRKRPPAAAEYGFMIEKIKEVLANYLYQETRSRPLVLPVVTEI